MDQQNDLLMKLIQAISTLMPWATLLMFLGVIMVAWAKGRPSAERTLILLGSAIRAFGVLISIGGNMMWSHTFGGGSRSFLQLVFGASQLFTFVGTALLLWGAVNALLRMGQLELLQQDQEGDHWL